MEQIVEKFKATIVDDYTFDGGSAAKHAKIAQMKDNAIAVCAAHACTSPPSITT